MAGKRRWSPGDAVIRDEFGLHPLAIEDALKAHERPKIEAYGESWFVIVCAATRAGSEPRIYEVATCAGAQLVSHRPGGASVSARAFGWLVNHVRSRETFAARGWAAKLSPS